jgi:hypothetical protein
MMIFADGERTGNALVFETDGEARASARALFHRWAMPTGYDVEEIAAPVNYRHENGQDVRVSP